jgi:hypothetical protein
MSSDKFLRGLNRILFPHERGIGSPTVIGSGKEFYERALEMAKEQFRRTEGQHRAVYFKIVPESCILFSDGDFEGYDLRLKVFSSPKQGFLNKIPDRMHKIKDMKKVIVYDEHVCQVGLPKKESLNYGPFEYAKRFSPKCVLELSDKIRGSMGSYMTVVMHPYNTAQSPGK